jgi:hypothetical protein
VPAKLEGQSNPLPFVETIMPISGGSALEFETKKEQKHYFCEVRNICVEGRVEKQDGLTSQSPSQRKM